MVDNNERRAVAKLMRWFADEGRWDEFAEYCHKAGPTRMADLIEPPVKPDEAMEAWVNGLHHAGKAASVREIIEEIVWAALTIDLGPNGNTDPGFGVDEGLVYTNGLMDEWEAEAVALCQGVDREPLLTMADDIEEMRNRRQIVRGYDYFIEMPRTLLDSIVSCIRKSCGEQAS